MLPKWKPFLVLYCVCRSKVKLAIDISNVWTKRLLASNEEPPSTTIKKHGVSKHKTSIWLKYELIDCDDVGTWPLKCAFCEQFKVRLKSMGNFCLLKALLMYTHQPSRSTIAMTCIYIQWLTIKKNCNLVACLSMHRSLRLRQEPGAHLRSCSGETSLQQMPMLCKPEELHSIHLGPGYRNDHACTTMNYRVHSL